MKYYLFLFSKLNCWRISILFSSQTLDTIFFLKAQYRSTQAVVHEVHLVSNLLGFLKENSWKQSGSYSRTENPVKVILTVETWTLDLE